MPCLIEAFERMRSHGLIAVRECYCPGCGPDEMLEVVRRWRDEDREPRGFVHVGAWDPPTPVAEPRVPLVFGSVAGDDLSYRAPAGRAVGGVVAACLDEEGAPYEWDRTPGSPILVPADGSVSGIPPGSSRHAIESSEEHRAVRAPMYPESAFDTLPGNPVRLLNVAGLRRPDVRAPHLRGYRRRPRVGDRVKLGFAVQDALAPKALRELGTVARRVQVEAMWVEVTAVPGEHPAGVYRGELTNAPVFLAPARVCLGSPVNFTADQVYPAATPFGGRPGRYAPRG